jgi:hypothetical protein
MDELLSDLVEWSLEHRALLRAVHLCDRDLYKAGEHLERAVDIYLRNWLPSLDSMRSADDWTAPYLDVAWVWHIHKLDPLQYSKDCHQWFGRLLDAPKGVNPFSFSTSLVCNTANQCTAITSDTSDSRSELISKAERQASLLWHLRWPEYDEIGFLEDSVDRYKMMLALMGKHPKTFIVPTYDIDNIWHTHMAFPSIYQADCTRLAGREIGHDDSDSERAPGSKLHTGAATTERLWREEYGSEWRKQGAMYRGEPPDWYFSDRAAAAGRADGSGAALLRAGCERACAVTVIGCAFGTIEVRPVAPPRSRARSRAAPAAAPLYTP